MLPTKAARTQPAQRHQLEWWTEELGAYTLADCTPALLADARDKLVKQASGSTANGCLAILSHAFTVAWKEWGWIDHNPVWAVTKPKEPRGRVRFLSDEEHERLLEACRASSSPWLYPAVVLTLSTGMRASEVFGLTWDRLDLKRGRILLEETKNGERRVLPLTGLAHELLTRHSKVRRLDTNLVWPSRRDSSRPVSHRNVWLQALKAAEIEDFRFHDLRYSAASYMLMNRASIAELAEVLGHKALQMVKRYSHLSESHARGIVERMNKAVFGGGGNA